MTHISSGQKMLDTSASYCIVSGSKSSFKLYSPQHIGPSWALRAVVKGERSLILGKQSVADED
jgi:hypothetical protein